MQTVWFEIEGCSRYMARPPVKNFGGWVKDRLAHAEVPITDLSRETGISYPSLNNMLNSSSKGKLTRQDADTVEKIAPAMVRLRVIEDEREAWAAAGFMPEGYAVVKESSNIYGAEPPENFADWPQELQEALAYTKHMDRETQIYIYGLWRKQASAHYDIHKRTEEARQKLEEREKQLREQGG